MINELSDKISNWLQNTLTPDKMQPIQDFINNRFHEVVQHKINLYTGYIGLSKENFLQHLHTPMPDIWNETTGKAIEQLIKSLGG